MCENREILQVAAGVAVRSGKACGRKPDMNACRKSDILIVPTIAPNEGSQRPEEAKEEREMTKGNSRQQPAGAQAQSWDNPWMGLERIRQAARRDSGQRFNSLMHHLTLPLMRKTFKELRKDAAAGVDEQTWREYKIGLEDRLSELHERVQNGRYRAKPSKRAYIPKPDGEQRPIGIAALEDKIVQGTVVRVLNQIYEEDFLGFSYGFRPERGTHKALDAVWVGIMRRKINWVLDADIRSFFDSLDHDWMMRFVEHRIGDRRVLRLIGKWLRAGVSEQGQWSKTKVGTPQGSVISPLLANIFLHYVLDLWVNKWRETRAKGEMIIVRYADDFVMGFQYRDEAQQCLNDLAQRMGKFNLRIHEQKTRQIEFGRFAKRDRHARGEGKPETFDFLGFTHICATTRENNRFTIRRKPIAKRMARKLKEIKTELMKRRHNDVANQGQWLNMVLHGYFNFFAVPGTSEVLSVFRKQVCRTWLRALRRRSHKARKLTWKRVQKLFDEWVPKVRIVHPYPNQRLIV